MRPADPTIERHWLEYPDGIPVEAWGKDHNTTILYAETRAVDHEGWLPYDDPRMRVDRRYPTRLHNEVEVHGHTDFDCLLDAQAAGLLTYDENAVPEGATTSRVLDHPGLVTFTAAGWTYVNNLRRKRAEQ